MKKFLIVFALFCAVFQLLADDDERLKLAVMDFEDLSGKLSDETLSGASEYFRVIFAQTNRYIIISKDRQKNEISDMRKKFNTDPTYKSCTDKNCQIQLGQALSADLILKTSVSFFAGSYTLASELIDLEKEATIIAATEEYDGTPQALKTAIKNIVNKIVEAEKKASNQTASTTPVYQEPQQTIPAQSKESKDSKDCKHARNEATVTAWKTYIRRHSDGECAEEAKEFLDKQSCTEAEKENTLDAWKKYLGEFKNGECAIKAEEAIKRFEAAQDAELYSKADEKLNKTFSGRWNLGLGAAFNTPSKVGLSTGLDFNFKVFNKPYGGGAGNLFIGLGFDLRYWIQTGDGLSHWRKNNSMFNDENKIKNNLINLPLQLNMGYEFKIKNQNLRYIGLWVSPGVSFDMDKNTDMYPYDGYYKRDTPLFFTISFSWEAYMNMIFKNGMLLNIGLGGNKSKAKALKGYKTPVVKEIKKWKLDHTFLMIGTGVIF